jgi:hypothetical protein
MAETEMARRPDGAPPRPARSIRISDELWNAARQRAAERGETFAYAIITFLQEYVK